VKNILNRTKFFFVWGGNSKLGGGGISPPPPLKALKKTLITLP